VGLAALVFSDAAAAGNAIRQEFQGMLSDGGKAQEVFTANEDLFVSFDIFNATQLQNMASAGMLLDHPFLNFIKVE